MKFDLTPVWDHLVASNLGGLSIGLIAVILFYIFKKEPFKIFAYFKDRKDKKLEQSLSFVESEHISDDAKALIKESLEHTIYKRYAGVGTDTTTRLILYAFNSKFEHKLKRDDIKRAYRHMLFDNGEVNIELSKLNHVMRWVVTIYSNFIIFLGLALLIASIFEKQNDLPVLFTFILLGIIAMFSGLMVSSANWPYHSAKKLQKLISDANEENKVPITLPL
jgi:hypothetical protein